MRFYSTLVFPILSDRVFKKSVVFFAVLVLSINGYSAAVESKSLDDLLAELKNTKIEDTSKVNLLNLIGYKYWIVDANESIRFGNQALELSEYLFYTKGLARANRIIGVAYWSQGLQNKALEYLKKANELYKTIQNKKGIANTTLNLGMVYADLKTYEKAKECYESAINDFTALGLKGRIATTFTKIGTLLIEQQKEQEALKYLSDALNMHIESDFIYGVAEVHNKLGSLYLNKNEIEQASYHIRKSIELGERVNDVHGLTHNLINLAKTLRLSGKINEATVEVEKGLSLAVSNRLKQFELLAYEELMALKQLQNKPNEAIGYYDKFILLRDSLFNLEKTKQIAYLEFENELEKKDSELLKFKIQEKASAKINLILIISIVVLSISGFVIFYVSKQRIKESKQLTIKTKEYLESVQMLSKKELENSELKRKELKQQLDFKNSELTSYALNFIKKNEVVKQIQQTIDELKQTSSTSIAKDKLILDLNKIIRKNLSIDKDWEDFSRFFDDVYEGFYSTLKAKHESLTANDLKLCSLIRLNLNTKETANILGISPESAKTSRYRLRKKLELDASQEISSYLASLEPQKS